MAHFQALETPTAPRFLAIPLAEIASYPQEWHDGTCSGKYCYIPSYMEWHLDLQPELTSQPILTEWPLSPVPGPSTRAEPIEQPVFDGPQWSGRVRQLRQQPCACPGRFRSPVHRPSLQVYKQ